MYFLRALLIGLVCGSLGAAQAHSAPRATVDPTGGPTTNPLAALPFPPASPTAPAIAVSALEELDQLVAAQRDGLLHAADGGRALVGSFARIAAVSSDDHARRVTAEVLAKHGCSTEAVNQMPLLTGFEVSLAAAGLLATPTIELRSSRESSICATARDIQARIIRGEITEWNYGSYAALLGIAAPYAGMDPLHFAAPADRLGQTVGIDAYLSGGEHSSAPPDAEECKPWDCTVEVSEAVLATAAVPAAVGAAVSTKWAALLVAPVVVLAYNEFTEAVETCRPCVTTPEAPQPPSGTPVPPAESPAPTPETQSNESPATGPTEAPATDPPATSPNDDEKAAHGTCSSGSGTDPMRCDELRRAGFEAFQAALEEILKHCPLTEAERARLPEYDPRNFVAEPACDEAAVARDLALLAGEAESACPLYCQEQKAREEASNREREQRERMEACSRTTPTSDNPHDACATVRADLLAQATADPLAAVRLGSDVGLGIAPTAPTDPSVSVLAAARSAPEVVAAVEAAKRASE